MLTLHLNIYIIRVYLHVILSALIKIRSNPEITPYRTFVGEEENCIFADVTECVIPKSSVTLMLARKVENRQPTDQKTPSSP